MASAKARRTAARDELEAAERRAYVRTLVDRAPPLTERQLGAIATLTRSAVRAVHAATPTTTNRARR